MKCIDIKSPGGPEQLVVVDAPMPTVGAHDVLIKVAASGLNRADILQRKGAYPSPAGAPPNPGLECSGEVVEVGRDFTEFKRGDQVCALLQGGGYSEYCSVNAAQVLPLPANVDVVSAAALPEAYFTVWSNVFMFGRLRAGERFLVHGGSSGIGTVAIQLAKALGATVFATAGSDEKCRLCEELGAERAFNYKSEDFVAGVLEATDGEGANVVLDMVGGDYLNRNLEALAMEGRIVMIASMGGVNASVNVLRLMTKRAVLTGSTLRARDVSFKRVIREQLLKEVWPLFSTGELRPIIDRVFSVDEVGAAHTYMESSAHKGKLLLKW
jgi:NADPH2:quinone reductase